MILVFEVPPARAQATRSEKHEAPFAPTPLARIEPGVKIVDRAPDGWSQLVIKSQPRITSGDVDKTPAMTKRYVDMFFTAMLVGVGKNSDKGQTPFVLDRAAIGLGVSIDGQDTIVSKSTASQLGAKLGMIGDMVLEKSEEQLDQVVTVARSPTMMVVDSPTIWLRGDAHAPVLFRYAFLVDPRDGRAYSLVWILDRNARGALRWAADGPLTLIEPNLVAVCDMHVDISKFFLGVPAVDALAVVKMPQGVVKPISAAGKAAGSRRQYTPRLAFELETELWRAIFSTAR